MWANSLVNRLTVLLRTRKYLNYHSTLHVAGIFIFDSTDHIPVSNAQKVRNSKGTLAVRCFIWIFLVRRAMKCRVRRACWQIGGNFVTFWAGVVPSWSKIFVRLSWMLKIFIISCAIVAWSSEFFSLYLGIVRNSIHDGSSTIAIRKNVCIYT